VLAFSVQVALAQEIGALDSQKPNAWRTMGGFSLYGGGDVTGFTLVNEYLRYLTPHIKVGPNIKFSSANRIRRYKTGLNLQEDDFLLVHANIYEVGGMGYYEYLNPDRNGLEIGVGVFYRHLQNTIATGPNTEYIGVIRVPESAIGQYGENTVGFNVYLGFIVNISQAINLNLGGLVQGDTEGNGGFGAFGGLTVAF